MHSEDSDHFVGFYMPCLVYLLNANDIKKLFRNTIVSDSLNSDQARCFVSRSQKMKNCPTCSLGVGEGHGRKNLHNMIHFSLFISRYCKSFYVETILEISKIQTTVMLLFKSCQTIINTLSDSSKLEPCPKVISLVPKVR